MTSGTTSVASIVRRLEWAEAVSVMASLGVGGCRVCAGRFVCGVCYWVLDGIRDRTGGSTGGGSPCGPSKGIGVTRAYVRTGLFI